MASPATPVTITADTNHDSINLLCGWAIRAGADDTTINLRKGVVDGQLLAVIGILKDGADDQELSERSVGVDGGVYVQVVTGSIDAGVLYSG